MERNSGGTNVRRTRYYFQPYASAALCPAGETESTWYCGHYWPIVPAPDDRWWWLWSNWWNEDRQGKPKYSEKTCHSATLPTTNPTWPYQGRRGGKPASNRLSYGTATTKIFTQCPENRNAVGITTGWGSPSLLSNGYREVKRQEHEADRSPPTSAEVKKT
jgi:hypothetical protein